MTLRYLLGCVSMLTVFLSTASSAHCGASNYSDLISFPNFPLRYGDLLGKVIPDGQDRSVPYYEIYSFDFPSGPDVYFPLPVLRKVAIRWNVYPDVARPRFTNDFTGWLPWNKSCEAGVIDFKHSMRSPKDTWMFKFDVVYPDEMHFVGTSFSSCPERYLINWYCEEDLLIKIRNKQYCSYGARMSIYSSTGPNNVPWHLVVEDICRNGTPKMDDPRWTMTYDAPEQCPIDQPTGRKKRSTDKMRHYL